MALKVCNLVVSKEAFRTKLFSSIASREQLASWLNITSHVQNRCSTANSQLAMSQSLTIGFEGSKPSSIPYREPE